MIDKHSLVNLILGFSSFASGVSANFVDNKMLKSNLKYASHAFAGYVIGSALRGYSNNNYQSKPEDYLSQK